MQRKDSTTDDEQTMPLTISALIGGGLDEVLLNRPENPIEFLARHFTAITQPPNMVDECARLCTLVSPNQKPFQTNILKAFNMISTGTIPDFNKLVAQLVANLPHPNEIAATLSLTPDRTLSFQLFHLTVTTVWMLMDADARLQFIHHGLDTNRKGVVSRKFTEYMSELLAGIVTADQAVVPSAGVAQDIIDGCLGTGRHARADPETQTGHVTVDQDADVDLNSFRWAGVKVVLDVLRGNDDK